MLPMFPDVQPNRIREISTLSVFSIPLFWQLIPVVLKASLSPSRAVCYLERTSGLAFSSFVFLISLYCSWDLFRFTVAFFWSVGFLLHILPPGICELHLPGMCVPKQNSLRRILLHPIRSRHPRTVLLIGYLPLHYLFLKCMAPLDWVISHW